MRSTLILTSLLFSAFPTIASERMLAGSNLDDLVRESGEIQRSARAPKEFDDQRIIVIGKDGKSVSKFDRSKWKIVPRHDLIRLLPTQTEQAPQCAVEPPPPPPPPPAEKIVVKEKLVRIEKRIHAKHNLTAYLGRGYDGLDVSYDGRGNVTIQSKRETVIGASYTYRFDYEWNASAIAISNSDFLLGAGYSF